MFQVWLTLLCGPGTGRDLPTQLLSPSDKLIRGGKQATECIKTYSSLIRSITETEMTVSASS